MERDRWYKRGARITFLLVAILTAQIFCPGPAASQVSPVPPGLVLPIGTLIRTWESGATDLTTPNSVHRILGFKTGNFSINEAYSPYYASFPANQGIPEIMPSQPLYFVRFYTGTDPKGSWVMRAAEVRGLTPEQIRDRFALPNVPTMITMVVVPPNVAPLWTGYAGPIAGWGRGGGQQSYIMSKLQWYLYNKTTNPQYEEWKINEDYTAIENINWPYIPEANYLHGQSLGPQAMLYQPTVGGGNAGQVAAYLDHFIPRPYSDLENVYTLLDYLNFSGYGPGPLKAAMKQISPERYDALSTLGLRANLLFGDALMQRSQTLRLGLARGSGEPAAAAWPAGLGRLARVAYVCSFSDPRMVSPGMLPSPVTQRGIGIWARGVGEFGNQGSFGERTGFVYNTGGVVGGIDWQPRREVVVGLGAAYLGTGLSWDQSGGNADVSYAKFGLYGSYFTPRWFVDGVFSGGVNWASTQRHITIESDNPLIPGVNRVATSSQTGHDFMAQCRGGVNFSPWNWSLTPMAGLAYFYLHQNPFEEQGADSLNLNVGANEAQTLRSTLGVRLARTFTAPSGNQVTPDASLGWAHDFILDNRVINASLAELGGSFATNGFTGDNNSLLAGAGLTAQLTNGVVLSGRYHAEIGRSFTAHMVNLGCRYEF
jgi:outer membrane autotransporter protein